jgi:hypothetical protein
VTKQQLQEIIDTVFKVAEAAAKNPLLRFAIVAVHQVADSQIDRIAAALGVK